MFNRYESIRDKKHLTDYQVAKLDGIGRSTFSDWRSGRSIPKQEKLQKIANALGVSVEYLTSGKDTPKESTGGMVYYFDDDTAQTAQDIMENPILRILFKAARDSRPEDLQMAADLLERLKGTDG